MLLSAEHLSINFGSRQLLEDVNFYLNEGDKVGVIGINGTGKSTFLKVLAGKLEADAGTISRNPNVQVSLLEQNPPMEDDATVLEQVFLHFPKEFRELNEYEAKSMLNKLGLPDYEQKVGTLSGGQRKRVALAAALIHPADVLVLDEPTSGLDPVSRDELLEIFLQLAQDEGISILFSTHITSDLEKCADHIVYLRRGEVAADADADALRARYRTAALTAAQRDAAPEGLLGCKREREGFSALLRAEDAPRLGADTAPASLEDIMVHLEKEDGGL